MIIRRFLPAMVMLLLFTVSFVAAQDLTLSGDATYNAASSDSGIAAMCSFGQPDAYTIQNPLTVDPASFGLYPNGCGGVEKQLTSGSQNHVNPRVSDSKIVFEEWKDGVSSVGMYDISNGGLYQVYPGTLQQAYPDVSSRYIVYEQAGNKNNQVTNIYSYDLTTEVAQPVASATFNQNKPAISDRYVVYEDWRSGKADIYLADLNAGTSKAISSNNADQKSPDISGDFVVWEDWRSGNADIYMYQISTQKETKITDNKSNQKRPRISGNIIVYEDERNSASDVYIYSINTGQEFRIDVGQSKKLNPDVSGPLVVWEDYRNGNADICLLDLMTGRVYDITNNTSDQKNPSIYGNNIVWQDYRTGNANIFMYTFSSTGQTPETGGTQSGSYQFYGPVTICGSSAPVGAEIKAVIDGSVRGSCTVSQSGYYGSSSGQYLNVPIYSSDSGKTINFYLNDYLADQAVQVTGTGAYQLTLSANTCQKQGGYTANNYQLSGSAILNNQNLPAGSAITAYVGQEARSRATITTSGQYSINIPVTSSDYGKTISFAVVYAGTGYQAPQQIVIGNQVTGRFDLTFGATESYIVYTFSGKAVFGSQAASSGTVISALVNGQVRGQTAVTTAGSYSGLNVPIYAADSGKVITFTGTTNSGTFTATQKVSIGNTGSTTGVVTGTNPGDYSMMSDSVSAVSLTSVQGVTRSLDLTFQTGSTSSMYRFYGTATLDGSSVPSGTVIYALVDGQIRGQVTVNMPGWYGSEVGPYLDVPIYSTDVGKTITFETSNGAVSNQNQLIVSAMTVKKALSFTSQTQVGVDFTATPLAGQAPLTVKFTDKSTGSPRSYYWDFGDGTTSTDKNPTHTYTYSGTWSVGLQVTYWNSQTKSAVKQNYISTGSIASADARIGLNGGWNFVSIPKMLRDGQDTAKSIFGNIDVGGHSIFSYNPRTKSWNTLGASSIVSPLDAFWVYSQNPDTLYLYFAGDALQIPPTKHLVKGWNTFGVTSMNSVPAENALLSVKDEWVYVIGFESSNQRYQNTILNVPGSASNILSPGYGYWIYMNEEGDLAAIGL